MLEKYIMTPDGEEYVDVNNVREALGIKEEDDDNIFAVIKKLRDDNDLLEELYANHISQLNDYAELAFELGIGSGDAESIKDYIISLKKERDEFKEKCNKLKARTNALYGASCGCSASKEPAVRCNVISYSWNLSPIVARSLMDEPSYTLNNDSIRVELDLTPNASYKGTFDMEDLKKYIQNYGREKKLGIIESVDYQNAKTARAELAFLYKQVLGKEKLDTNLSPHEVMKAIHDEYKRREDFIRELSCSLGFGNPVVKPDNIDQKEKDILERIDGLKAGVWPCENSSTFAEHLRKEFPKFCKKYNVSPLTGGGSVHNWIQYIFGVLVQYRDCSDKVFNEAEEFRKEKRAVENVLAELRAKIREIYRSVVDDEWDEYLAYTSALNDINEEYKRVVHNFEERTADWSKAQQELDRYRLAVGSLLGIPKEARDDINAIERSFTFSKKKYKSLQEFRDNVCEIFDIPSNMADNYILKEIHDISDRYDELEEFRSDICGALDIEGMLGTPQQNDKYILEQIEELSDDSTRLDRYARLRSNICTALCLGGETDDKDILKRVCMTKDCHDALCKDYTELRKAIWDAMDRKPKTLPEENARLAGEVAELARGEKLLIEFRDDVAKAIGISYPTTNDFILKKVEYIYKEWGEAHDLAMELDRKRIDLTAKNSDLKQKFDFQSGLRQQWHARYESEHERANGVQKALDREREKCRVKDISLETAKKQYKKVCGNLETAECAINGMKSKIRELRKENAGLKKDVASLTGDASVDLYEEESDGTADTDD